VSPDPARVEKAFAEVFAKTDPADRADVLDRLCGEDIELRKRVEALLAAHEAAGSFLPLPKQAEPTESLIPTESVGEQIGRYKLLEQLGEGGMGSVWVAEQAEPVRRRVALKLIKPGMDTKQVLSRFAAERQALALMDHPNIAKVFDGGMTDKGRPFFVMEYVKGVPITDYCNQARLSIEERLRLFLPICQAVQHAHQKGVIHRDLKPSNLLVCLYDGQPVPKVIDFGLAKAISQQLTEHTLYTAHGLMVGTPLYMSPEQAEFNNLDVDTRTDIYSLGVILYELLTGTTPLEKQKVKEAAVQEILRLIKEEEPQKPSTKLSGSASLPAIAAQRRLEPAQLSRVVRGELDWIVMKCLEKERSMRYASASGLAMDIQSFLADEPVTAAAPSASYRIRKFLRRYKASIGIAATIAGLLVAGTIISSIQWLRAERARAGEIEQRILAESKTQEANDERRRAQEEREAATLAQQRAERLAYTSAMALARSDWERGSLTRLQQTLDETASYADRSFEWYYWQAQLHQERRTIHPHLGPIWDVRLAADQSDIVVTSSYRARNYHLDAKTGNVRAVYGSGPMSTDGRWLADGPRPGNKPNLIDTITGMRTAIHVPESHWKLALSPNGERLITTSDLARNLYMWNVATSTQLYEINRPFPANVGYVEFSPDGQWFANVVYFDDGSEIELRQASNGEPTRAAKAFGGAFAFTPDSRHLARWDAATEQIHFHSTSDLSDIKQIPCEKEPSKIVFSPDGTYVAILIRDNRSVVIFEVQTGRIASTYRVNDISGIAFTHDGQELVVSSMDGALRFFPIESRNHVKTDPHYAVQFSGDGSRLLTKTVSRWQSKLIDVASRKILAAYPNVSAVEVFPDGRRIVTAANSFDSDKNNKNPTTTITIADDTGNEIRSFPYGDYVTDLDVSPDGRHILVACRGSRSLLNAATGKTIFHRRNRSPRSAGGFLPDGTQLALWYQGEPLRFYDAATGRETGDSISFDPEPELRWAQFSPDGKRVVTSYENAAASIYGVSIYDRVTKERLPPITGHAGRVYAAYFLPPDGRRLVTKSSDGTVRVWDVEHGFELLSFRDDGYPLGGLAVAPHDGRMIAISGAEGVFLKEAATPEQVAAWQQPPTQPTDADWWNRQGGIQDWLVLAPFLLGVQEEYADELDKQQQEGEARLDPIAGDVAQVDGKKLTWQRVTTSDCVIDIQKASSSSYDYCLAYAVTHIYSDEPREGVRLLLGSDDLAKVYLNGEHIYEFRDVRQAIPADDEVSIDLLEGKNVLVCKVIDTGQDWGVSAQVVGEDYRPIPGVTTGLEP
jgi:serine/threonine protein kinase/WD40 repeat protein